MQYNKLLRLPLDANLSMDNWSLCHVKTKKIAWIHNSLTETQNVTLKDGTCKLVPKKGLLACNDLVVTLLTLDTPILISRATALRSPLLTMLLERGEYELPITFSSLHIRLAVDLPTITSYLTEKDLPSNVVRYIHQDSILLRYIEADIPLKNQMMLMALNISELLNMNAYWRSKAGKNHLQICELIGPSIGILVRFFDNWRSVPLDLLTSLSIQDLYDIEVNVLLGTKLFTQSVALSIVAVLITVCDVLSKEEAAPYLRWAFGDGWNKNVQRISLLTDPRKRRSTNELQCYGYTSHFRTHAPGYLEYIE